MNYINDATVGESARPLFNGRRPILRYATASEYFERLQELREGGREGGKEGAVEEGFPTIRGSPFLPLVTNREDNSEDGPGGRNAWSGFYSGYPEVKARGREVEAIMRAAEMVSALLPPSISGAWQKDLESAR
ncbi:hypothetical protein NSK_000816 [Nannochloropsis salina CCMP1776]|uniref:Uncharacterized protein n=1 Tax=Nannochloropsis salina CCMP1776 TaxID=1027361 RepID=A0A4D9DBP0_9STRA|nr:hypothetical protein NSK_000816 [Nannochloropsis salina CCMP1776]|eukprot:TFJ87463.1 hypothetical protein NSK_000816 [Nannochloropsis salina CCMP1776]